MNFLIMQQELSDRVGAYDNSVSGDLTKIKRWINMAQQYVCSKQNWPFMIDYEIIQTVPDVTTGTVSVSAAATTLTFSSGPSDSVANRYIKFSSSDDWYKITAHTAASTSATISPAYGQTSSLSSGTFTIRKLLYVTTTPMSSYLDIKKTVLPGMVDSVNRRNGDFFLPLYLSASDPIDYIMGPLDSSGNLQFSLAPPPSTAINLLVRGVKTLTDLSSDADVSIIPVRWHNSVLDIASFYAFSSLDDTRAADFFATGEAGIKDMSRVYSPDLGRHRVMGSVDGGGTNDGPVYTLSGQYGPQFYL